MKKFFLDIVFLLFSIWIFQVACNLDYPIAAVQEESKVVDEMSVPTHQVCAFAIPKYPSMPVAELFVDSFSLHIISLARLQRNVLSAFHSALKNLLYQLSMLTSYYVHDRVKHVFDGVFVLHAKSPSDFYIFSFRRILI